MLWLSKQPIRPIGEKIIHEQRILDQVVSAGSTQDANALESLQRGPNLRNGRDLAFRSGQFLEGILTNRWLFWRSRPSCVSRTDRAWKDREITRCSRSFTTPEPEFRGNWVGPFPGNRVVPFLGNQVVPFRGNPALGGPLSPLLAQKQKFIDGLRDCPNSLISIKTVSQAPKGRI